MEANNELRYLPPEGDIDSLIKLAVTHY